VTEPNDPFDTWLHAQVEPLRPPPGTFERITRQARRRKRRRALVSAASAGAAAVVIVATVVAVPRLVPSLHSAPKPAANSSLNRHSFGPSHPATTPPARLTPSASTPVSGSGPARVPADLAPTSITFVNFSTGWVIGQVPGCGKTYCTTMAETTNYGQSWTPVPAPPTGAPDGSTGVSQIRFLDTSEGWAFGPQLWETHDGGQTWIPIRTDGMRVTGLETVGVMAYAVFARCTGSGADFAANCTRVAVYSSPVGSDVWTPVPNVGSGFGFNNGYVSGKIVLAHASSGYSEGYFYAPDGLLYSGAATQGTSWQLAADRQMPCVPGSAQPDGQPSGGQLAASVAGSLILACPGTYGSSQEHIYTSTDGGQTWQPRGTLTVQGSATSLAAGPAGGLTLATTGGIYESPNGQNWTQAEQGPPGGFSYVGMTNATEGVAVPAQPAKSHSVWYTTDGGTSWTQSSLSNP
jgi:photosystem II stability/assembly factor-like uncharacterized protein